MKPRKPRKPIGPGDAYGEIQRTATVRQQQAEERDRHRSALSGFLLQRQKAALHKDPSERSIELARISQKETDEYKRHRSKMAALNSRIHKKP
ncbi:hypothetical protein M2281_005552 [Mesorhizobium soli]|uniref:hypothetical protein n=1 Tax=Pseudaminobacter soli (ex Li et al. 2025) TaxID=1295366 RepID=UPI002474C523|nr:hypothetical protein [Mesorhizobium soli]MDH6234931.1 hypothetical protein [Mesorhizobium soli]